MSRRGAVLDVVLVDAGGANITSVQCALERLGVDAPMTGDAERIRRADRVVLPGVGAAAAAMARLRELGLVEVLRSLEQPVLGVCLGMQLLHEASTEGAGGRAVGAGDAPVECLGLLPGTVERLEPGPGAVRVPHMGWNLLEPGPAAAGDDPVRRVLCGAADPRAYFVHSWAAPVGPDTVALTRHGREFAAVVQRGTVTGMQFHPERSGDLGSRLLAGFCGIDEEDPR